jgi:hypothetical protein
MSLCNDHLDFLRYTQTKTKPKPNKTHSARSPRPSISLPTSAPLNRAYTPGIPRSTRISGTPRVLPWPALGATTQLSLRHVPQCTPREDKTMVYVTLHGTLRRQRSIVRWRVLCVAGVKVVTRDWIVRHGEGSIDIHHRPHINTLVRRAYQSWHFCIRTRETELGDLSVYLDLPTTLRRRQTMPSKEKKPHV